jgi:uncharacterized hydrophobic protein (TIGR00271 family)
MRGFVDDEDVDHVSAQAELSAAYLVLMATAGVLSAVALLTNSIPILIGSMVVAPALAPFALIAFGLLGGRWRPAARGLWVGGLGLAAAVAAAVGTTWAMNVLGVLPPELNLLDKPLLEERVNPGWWSVAAGLAAGIAGALALAHRKTDTMVGVVASLALVPAAGAAGIALLSGDPAKGLGGVALLAINIAMIVVGGLATLAVMRPARRR